MNDQAKARAQMLATFRNAARELEAAQNVSDMSYVIGWADLGIACAFTQPDENGQREARPISLLNADTFENERMAREFMTAYGIPTNGHNQRAAPIPRQRAIAQLLADTRGHIATLEAL